MILMERTAILHLRSVLVIEYIGHEGVLGVKLATKMPIAPRHMTHQNDHQIVFSSFVLIKESVCCRDFWKNKLNKNDRTYKKQYVILIQRVSSETWILCSIHMFDKLHPWSLMIVITTYLLFYWIQNWFLWYDLYFGM